MQVGSGPYGTPVTHPAIALSELLLTLADSYGRATAVGRQLEQISRRCDDISSDRLERARLLLALVRAIGPELREADRKQVREHISALLRDSQGFQTALASALPMTNTRDSRGTR